MKCPTELYLQNLTKKCRSFPAQRTSSLDLSNFWLSIYYLFQLLSDNSRNFCKQRLEAVESNVSNVVESNVS